MYNTFTGEVAMRARAARWIRLVTAAVVGIAVGTGVSLKIPLIPVIAIPAAVLVTFLVRRKVEDEVKDERLIRMTEKAARIAFLVYSLTAAVLGAFLTALDRNQGTTYAIGMSLVISVGFLFVLYIGFYIFYTKEN